MNHTAVKMQVVRIKLLNLNISQASMLPNKSIILDSF